MECQKLHWFTHKKFCARLAKEAAREQARQQKEPMSKSENNVNENTENGHVESNENEITQPEEIILKDKEESDGIDLYSVEKDINKIGQGLRKRQVNKR